MPPRARIKTCCASAHGRDAPPITIWNAEQRGPEDDGGGERRRGVWRLCQCPTGARLRDKGEDAAGHTSHMSCGRIGDRATSHARPPKGLRLAFQKTRPMAALHGLGRISLHDAFRGAHPSSHRHRSSTRRAGQGPQGSGRPRQTRRIHLISRTSFCSLPATVALRTAPPRAVSDKGRGHRHRIASHVARQPAPVLLCRLPCQSVESTK